MRKRKSDIIILLNINDAGHIFVFYLYFQIKNG